VPVTLRRMCLLHKSLRSRGARASGCPRDPRAVRPAERSAIFEQRNSSLPDPGDAVRVEVHVCADDRDVLVTRLRDQPPVKRVSVVEWHVDQPGEVFIRDGQQLEFVPQHVRVDVTSKRCTKGRAFCG
jgi:hypothetical protein